VSTFVFKAMDLAGGKARGEVEADSKQAVTDQLKSRGLIVLDIADKHSSRELNVAFLRRVKHGELAVVSRQLATMIASGMTTLVAVRKDVEAGLPFSDALEHHPKIFNPLFVAMTRAGETSGMLEQALEQVADQLEKEASLRRQIRSAMVYPTVVVTFALLVMIGLVSFLIPVFVKVFKQFPGPDGKPPSLPAITQFSVDLSNLILGSWYLLLLVAGGSAYAFLKWKKSDAGRKQWDRLRLRIPMKIGDVVQKVAIARWSRTLSSLVAAGVPLLQALEITGKTAGNVVVDEAMTQVINSVKQGGTIAEPLRKTPIFPAMVTHMVGVGEETGALDAMLSKVADFYEDQVEAAVKTLTSILEPIMIIVIGSMVGFIVISMYLPLFKVYDAVK